MSLPGCRFNAVLPVFALLASSALAMAQAPPQSAAAPAGPAPVSVSTGPALASLRPALDQVGSAVANLRIGHWKTPGDIRKGTEEDVASIQRDLSTTLPPLLDQAQASTSGQVTLAPSFAVFRNIDALYDVLLRVTEMATLAGSQVEATRLEDARSALELARAQLGNLLLAGVSAQDAELARLRAQKVEAAKTPPPAPTKTVVNDGPETAKPKPHKRKPKTSHPPSSAPAPAPAPAPPQ